MKDQEGSELGAGLNRLNKLDREEKLSEEEQACFQAIKELCDEISKNISENDNKERSEKFKNNYQKLKNYFLNNKKRPPTNSSLYNFYKSMSKSMRKNTLKEYKQPYYKELKIL